MPKNVYFVPAHPIAGTEYSGPKAGFESLFQERWTILTPTEHTQDDALQKIRSFWEKCEAKIQIMSSEKHDQIFATISHLPHVLAYTLVQTTGIFEQLHHANILQYSAGGFRDTTRIAASDPRMWTDICLANGEAI